MNRPSRRFLGVSIRLQVCMSTGVGIPKLQIPHTVVLPGDLDRQKSVAKLLFELFVSLNALYIIGKKIIYIQVYYCFIVIFSF